MPNFNILKNAVLAKYSSAPNENDTEWFWPIMFGERSNQKPLKTVKSRCPTRIHMSSTLYLRGCVPTLMGSIWSSLALLPSFQRRTPRRLTRISSIALCIPLKSFLAPCNLTVQFLKMKHLHSWIHVTGWFWPLLIVTPCTSIPKANGWFWFNPLCVILNKSQKCLQETFVEL